MLKSLGKGARVLVPQQSGDVGDVEGDKICRPHVFRETGTLLKKREKRKGVGSLGRVGEITGFWEWSNMIILGGKALKIAQHSKK